MFEFKIFEYDNPDIIKGLFRLYQEVFNVDIEGEFEHTFLNNPFGKAIGAVAVDHNEVIGHFAVRPLPFLLDGSESTELLSFGAMVSPRYQGKGIFVKVADCLLSHLDKSRQYNFITAFPNDNSLHVHLTKMAYIFVKDFNFVIFRRQFEKPKRAYALSKKIFKYPKNSKPFCLNGTDVYCKWRFAHSRYLTFEDDLGNQYILTSYKDKLQILISNQSCMDEYWDFVEFLYSTYHADKVSAWNTVDFGKHVAHTETRNYHFTIRPLKSCMYDVTRLTSYDNWSYHMADNELF